MSDISGQRIRVSRFFRIDDPSDPEVVLGSYGYELYLDGETYTLARVTYDITTGTVTRESEGDFRSGDFDDASELFCAIVDVARAEEAPRARFLETLESSEFLSCNNSGEPIVSKASAARSPAARYSSRKKSLTNSKELQGEPNAGDD